MKKILFGIFAHPDDEALGPCGALLKEVQNGTELHLITLTNGNAGTNPDNLENLGKVRLEEWHKAGQLLGAHSMQHFGYTDGQLCNNDMIEIGKRLIDYISETLANEPNDTEVEIMTLDLNGYSGHIDHIVAARAASFAFYRLKPADGRLKSIRYACQSIDNFKQTTDWIFAENGRRPDEINQIVDARDLREDILEIMRAHHTQRGDFEYVTSVMGEDLGLNYFIVRQ